MTHKIITASVVVLIPPAVPPGEPPINIHRIIIKIDAGWHCSIGILVNPAVLKVIDVNNVFIIL